MANPFVSVVVTTYNQGQYIEETLASVLAQKYADFEIIVVDDGSTDDTSERLESFGSKIRVIRQPNAGVAGSRNTGVSHARGEYVAFLDGDDLWHEDKLSVQVSAALAYPKVGLIAVDGIQFDGNDILLNSLFGEIGSIGQCRGNIVIGNFYSRLLQSQIIFTTSQVMVAAAVLRAIGPSDSRFAVASDYDLYTRISKNYSFALVRRSLVSWRYLPTSASGPRHLRSMRYLPEDIAVLKKANCLADMKGRKTIKKIIKGKCHTLARQLYDYGRDGNRGLATARLMDLVRQNPDALWSIVYLGALWSPRFLTKYVGSKLRVCKSRSEKFLSLLNQM